MFLNLRSLLLKWWLTTMELKNKLKICVVVMAKMPIFIIILCQWARSVVAIKCFVYCVSRKVYKRYIAYQKIRSVDLFIIFRQSILFFLSKSRSTVTLKMQGVTKRANSIFTQAMFLTLSMVREYNIECWTFIIVCHIYNEFE